MPNTRTTISSDAAAAVASNLGSAIKLPGFWKENPALWFAQVEAQFELQRIEAGKIKFFTIIAALETEMLSQVSDIVLNPPNDAYDKIKQRLIEHFSVSEENRIKQLLNNLDIGDKKPSALLREMRMLANGGVTADFLQTMWMQRLPPQTQAILSTSTESLDIIAKMADKIGDISISTPSIAAINSPYNFSEMKKQIEELTTAVQRLRTRRTRSNSRSRSQIRASSSPSLCYYHHRFGRNAKKCRQPCSFNSSQSENFQNGH